MSEHVETIQAWNDLAVHYETIRHLHLRDLFADDPKRGERLAVEAAGLYLDFSKNRINGETLSLLIRLARESHLQRIIPEIESKEEPKLSHDSSTDHLIRYYRKKHRRETTDS
jgi:glucose-6-phosphate isomerase